MYFRGLFVLLSAFSLAISHLPATAQEPTFTAGDKVIILANALPVRVHPNKTGDIVSEIWYGQVTRIITIETDDIGNVWLYLENNAYGWVQAEQDGQPTLEIYVDGQLENLLMELTAEIDSGAETIENYARRGMIHLELRNYDAAESDFTRAVELDGASDSEYYLYRGKLYLDSQNYLLATSDYNRIASQRDNVLPSTLNRMGLLFEYQNQPAAALNLYSQATQITPDWGLIHANIGAAYHGMGISELALENYEAALVLDPNLAFVHVNMGLEYSNRGDQTAALAEYEQAIEVDPFLSFAYVQRGYYYYETTQDVAATRADFEKALELDPESDRAYAGLGIVFIEAGNVSVARENFEQALSLNPSNVTALYNMASIYARSGDFEASLEAYNTTVALDSELSFGALLYRSQLHVAFEDYNSALGDLMWYMRSTNLREDFRTAGHLLIGNTFLRMGDYQGAIIEYENAFATWDDFARFYATYGIAYRVTAPREQLIQEISEQTRTTPNDADLYFEIGHMYMEFGQWSLAMNAYKDGLALKPNAELSDFVEDFETLLANPPE